MSEDAPPPSDSPTFSDTVSVTAPGRGTSLSALADDDDGVSCGSLLGGRRRLGTPIAIERVTGALLVRFRYRGASCVYGVYGVYAVCT